MHSTGAAALTHFWLLLGFPVDRHPARRSYPPSASPSPQHLSFRSRPAPRVATPFPLPGAGSSSTRYRSPGRLTDRFAGRLLSAETAHALVRVLATSPLTVGSKRKPAPVRADSCNVARPAVKAGLLLSPVSSGEERRDRTSAFHETTRQLANARRDCNGGDILITPVVATWHERRDCFRVDRGADRAIAMPRQGQWRLAAA